MKFLKSLTEGIKDAVGIEKKWEWGEEEMEWFENFESQLATYRHKIEKRAEPYYKQYGVPLISRRDFVELCRSIMKNDLDLDDDDLRDVHFDDVFDTHLRGQGKDFGDNLEAVCFTKCLVAPFREPSNFFYFFALCDTNKSGGLDTVEFKRMLHNKFKSASKGGQEKEKIHNLMEEFFPSDDENNVLIGWFKKISGRNEVHIKDYVQAFPQDLLQECTCSEYIDECVAAH